jgi:hypothetical protein
MLVSPLLTPQDQVMVASGWFIERLFRGCGRLVRNSIADFANPLVLDLGAVRHS